MPKQYPLILVFLLINLSGAAPLATAYEDKILAVVNNNLITQKDLQDYVRTTFANLKTQNVPQSQIDDIMAELQADGLKKLIEDNLMLSRANEIKMEIPEKAIQQKIESVKAKYPSEEVFNAALMQHGATYGDFRNKVIEQLKIAGIIEHEVRSKIYVKPQEVTNYYNENKHQFSSSEKINVDSIFIGYKKNEARSVAEQKAAEIMERLKAGDDFLAVAKEVTDIPSIGVVERGTLAKDIEKILFSLSVDEISEPLNVDNGIFIFKLRGRQPAVQSPFETVKDKIYNYIYQKKLKDEFDKWIAGLKEKAYVEIKN